MPLLPAKQGVFTLHNVIPCGKTGRFGAVVYHNPRLQQRGMTKAHFRHSEAQSAVGIRNSSAENFHKSAEITGFENGLPRQSADWLAMTGFGK